MKVRIIFNFDVNGSLNDSYKGIDRIDHSIEGLLYTSIISNHVKFDNILRRISFARLSKCIYHFILNKQNSY